MAQPRRLAHITATQISVNALLIPNPRFTYKVWQCRAELCSNNSLHSLRNLKYGEIEMDPIALNYHWHWAAVATAVAIRSKR